MNMNDKKWHRRFLEMAEQVATWSKDPECKVGCVLVSPDGRQVSWGYNGFPRGLLDKKETLANKEKKNELMVHAELNAILNCVMKPQGWTLVSSKFPCMDCAKAIIQSGVAVVVAPWSDADKVGNWAENQKRAFDMMQSVGIKIHTYGREEA